MVIESIEELYDKMNKKRQHNMGLAQVREMCFFYLVFIKTYYLIDSFIESL